MNYLNAQQLAFILDIKKEDARAIMCNALTRHEGIPKDGLSLAKVDRDKKNKVKNLIYESNYT